MTRARSGKLAPRGARVKASAARAKARLGRTTRPERSVEPLTEGAAEAARHQQLGVQLEQELGEALRAFAAKHDGLVREACQVSSSVEDLAPVVMATMFGHVVGNLRRSSSREHVERLLTVLLDRFESVEKAGASKPDVERGEEMH